MPRYILLIVLLSFLVGGCSDGGDSSVVAEVEMIPEPLPDILAAEEFIQEQMSAAMVPGMAVGIVKNGELAWSRGFGLADVESETPMNDDTLINVASISKTVVNAAILQLSELGSLDLDADVNTYVPFDLRNPAHPDVPITVRQLLSHRSSIRDGEILGDTYACGDPAVSLADWIEGYFITGGSYHNPDRTFWDDAPGERYRYSNLGYGLLGYLVEQITGEPFPAYTRREIFDPLGMSEAAWHLADIDITRHAVPQAYLTAGQPIFFRLFERTQPDDTQLEDGYRGLYLQFL